ncbi:toll/interleukin-1 receptor domain-containing protein [Pseudomonas lundensis]|uniref:toll/interleukin-1 receptor domain-containing protein n=1 Tax=Pseudomonas lundensis TaxID=86185 RepID=UPI000F0470B2
MAKVFFSYSHDDEALRDQLEKHLSSLKHEGLIESWHDRRLIAGEMVDAAIDLQIDEADVVLLLVSASFLSSHYCYSVEMKRAMERHFQGKCRLVAVILRACDWSQSPIGKLLAVPQDGKPITSWTNLDEAYTDVVRQVRSLLKEISSKAAKPAPSVELRTESYAFPLSGAVQSAFETNRSSNLRLRKTFTDFEIDQFAHDGFEYMQRFFENSLQELQQRNPGVQGALRRLSDTRFSATIYMNGRIASECSIALGDGFSRTGITYSGQISSSGFNEMLSVSTDDQSIFFKTLMGHVRSGHDQKLSHEGAAELYWGRLLEPLQR